jgi:hypothetical protein
MELRRNVSVVRALNRLYVKAGFQPEAAIEMARRDVFGRHPEPPSDIVAATTASGSSSDDDLSLNSEFGIIDFLTRLLRWH